MHILYADIGAMRAICEKSWIVENFDLVHKVKKGERVKVQEKFCKTTAIEAIVVRIQEGARFQACTLREAY